MTLISETYRNQLAQLHNERKDFGTSSAMYGAIVKQLIAQYKPKSFIDYGCGKQALKPFVSCTYIPYDPAIPEVSASPGAADFVMTSEVLEHLEPQHLEAVMEETHTSSKSLPNGGCLGFLNDST
jgi:hypothetical protein